MSAERTNGWFQNAVASRSVQTMYRKGREYLRFPLVPLREMVLDYPENGTREYLPAEHIAETLEAWDGVPITFTHPENRTQTVNSPDAYTGIVIGEFFDPEFVGGEKLRGTAMVDVEKAEGIGETAAKVVRQLQAGKELNVSAGYATVDDEHTDGVFQGDSYDLIQGPLFPDHIAVFPADSKAVARCSPADGCAAPRANCLCADSHDEQTSTTDTIMSQSEIEEIREDLESLTAEVESLTNAKKGEERSRANQSEVLDKVPAAGRTAFEQRKTDEPNYGPAGAPGGSKRRQRRANAECSEESNIEVGSPSVARSVHAEQSGGEEMSREDVPAAGRSAWEERNDAENRTNSESGDNRHSDEEEGPPAAGRSAWEERNDE